MIFQGQSKHIINFTNATDVKKSANVKNDVAIGGLCCTNNKMREGLYYFVCITVIFFSWEKAFALHRFGKSCVSLKIPSHPIIEQDRMGHRIVPLLVI